MLLCLGAVRRRLPTTSATKNPLKGIFTCKAKIAVQFFNASQGLAPKPSVFKASNQNPLKSHLNYFNPNYFQ